MLLRIRSCEPLIPIQQWIHTAELNLSDKTSTIADLLYSILLFNFGACKDGRSILVGSGNQAKYALGNELFLQLVKDDFALPISMAYHLFLSDSEILELRILSREEASLRSCEVLALRLSSSTSLETALQNWSKSVQERGNKSHAQVTQAPKQTNLLVSSSIPYTTPNGSEFTTKKRDAGAPTTWNDMYTSKKSKVDHSANGDFTVNPLRKNVDTQLLTTTNQQRPMKSKNSVKSSSSESSESDDSSSESESSSAVSVSVSSGAASVSTASTSSEEDSSESSDSSSDDSTSSSDSSTSDGGSLNSQKLEHHTKKTNDIPKSNTSGFSHSLNTANEMSYFRDSSAVHSSNPDTLYSGSTIDGDRTTLFDTTNFLKSSPTKRQSSLEQESDIVYKRFGEFGTDSVDANTSDFRSADDKNGISNNRSFHEFDEDPESSTSVRPPGSGSSATKSRNLRRKKSRLMKKYGQDIEAMPGDLDSADRPYPSDESKDLSEGQSSHLDSDTIKVEHRYNAVPVSKNAELDVEFPPGSKVRFTIMDLNVNTYTPEVSEKSGRVITSNDKEVKIQLDTKHRYKIKYGPDGEIIQGRFGTIPDEQLVEGIVTYGWDLMSDIHKLVQY